MSLLGGFAVGRTSTKSENSEDMFAKRNDRWLTPLPIIESLGEFDLDPCGAPGHETAREVWTPESVGDGLSLPWHGRVWLNPPYGRTMPDWVKRLAEHGEVTALIFARTDTALFHDVVWPNASAVFFLRGRLTFLLPDGEAGASNSGAPSVLVAFGERDVEAVERSGLNGFLARLGDSR